MKKVNVIKNGVVVFSGSFETQELAEQYISYHTSQGNFGRPAVYGSVKNEVTGQYDQVLVTPAEPFEVIQTDITAEVAAQISKEDKIAKGKHARQACEAVLDYIAGENLSKGLTSAQITNMQTVFSDIERALASARPTSAKQLISALQPDEVLLTTETKAVCLALLKDY